MVDLTVTQVIDSVKNTASSAAAGLSALPGGMSAVASVVNNASGAINSIPGASAVSGLINSATGTVTGALGSVTGALGAGSGALGALVGKGLDALKAGGASLSALATTGLPAGAAAELNTAIAALNSGGAVQVKMPTVAKNTFDTSELKAQLSSVFGSSKIPAPASGDGLAAAAKAAMTKLKDYQKLAEDMAASKAAQRKITDEAIAKYNDAKNNLPEGDPEIARLKASGNAEIKKYNDLLDESKQKLDVASAEVSSASAAGQAALANTTGVFKA